MVRGIEPRYNFVNSNETDLGCRPVARENLRGFI